MPDRSATRSLWTGDPARTESQLEGVEPETFDVDAVRRAKFDYEALERRLKPYRRLRRRKSRNS